MYKKRLEIHPPKLRQRQTQAESIYAEIFLAFLDVKQRIYDKKSKKHNAELIKKFK